MKKTGKREKPIFAKNVIARRKSLKWSGHKLAEMADIPYPTLRDIEAGINAGRDETKRAIAKALGTNLSALYSEAIPTQIGLLEQRLIPGEQTEAFLDAAQVLQNFAQASELRRLIALYILSDKSEYLDLLRALPGSAQVAQLLSKIPKAL